MQSLLKSSIYLTARACNVHQRPFKAKIWIQLERPVRLPRTSVPYHKRAGVSFLD